MNRPLDKKEIYLHDGEKYWPIGIKEIIQWFPFLYIKYYNARKVEIDISLLPSFLKVFGMFQFSLSYHEHNEEEHVL